MLAGEGMANLLIKSMVIPMVSSILLITSGPPPISLSIDPASHGWSPVSFCLHFRSLQIVRLGWIIPRGEQ